MAEKSTSKTNRVAVAVAIIGATGVVVAAAISKWGPPSNEVVGGAKPLVTMDSRSGRGDTPVPLEYTGRVVDDATEKAVASAKVSLDYTGVPLLLYTDSEGIYRFMVSASVTNLKANVRVEAKGYKVYRRYVSVTKDTQLEDIRLEKNGSTTQNSLPSKPVSQQSISSTKADPYRDVAGTYKSSKSQLEGVLSMMNEKGDGDEPRSPAEIAKAAQTLRSFLSGLTMRLNRDGSFVMAVGQHKVSGRYVVEKDFVTLQASSLEAVKKAAAALQKKYGDGLGADPGDSLVKTNEPMVFKRSAFPDQLIMASTTETEYYDGRPSKSESSYHPWNYLQRVKGASGR